MEVWNHCENPSACVPNEVLEQAESVRARLPNEYCDPKIVAQLYDEILDEYRLCDDIGLHIVTNEHHSGINSLYGASPMILGIAARSENDTGNNPHNPMYGINRIGADGQLLTLIGSQNTDSGGNSMAPIAMVNPAARPTKVDRASDVTGLVDTGELSSLFSNSDDAIAVL